jgi:transposase, IS5 family
MPKQPTIPGLRDAMKKKMARREQFLAEMEAAVPWGRLIGLIASHYPKAGPKGGSPPMPLETMLRMYFLENWYALSDPMAEETLYDSEAMRRFAGIELGDDRIPDETIILNFRHLLERHGLTEAIFADVNAHLSDKGITLRSGTLVDATIIDAPSSTKNKAKARDPEMSSTKKGNDWYFGMKAHIGVDADSGVTQSLETSTAKLHDSQVWDDLLHGEETSVWADKGYVSAEREAPGKVWGVMRKAPKGGNLHTVMRRSTASSLWVRAKVEHPFRVIKRQFGHVKTRYRGLARNRTQLFTLFALGNLILVRRRLLA